MYNKRLFTAFLESLRTDDNCDTIDAIEAGDDQIFNGVSDWEDIAEELNIFHENPVNYSLERNYSRLKPWEILGKNKERFADIDNEMDELGLSV